MPRTETITVKGSEFVQAIRDLFRQNDVGKVCVLYERKRLFEIPLITGDPSAPANILKDPLLAALNAFSTLVDECTIEVERVEKKEQP